MDQLDELLKGTGVKPAKKETPFTSMDSQLKDLFDYFGEIFGNHEKKNGLPKFKNPYDESEDI